MTRARRVPLPLGADTCAQAQQGERERKARARTRRPREPGEKKWAVAGRPRSAPTGRCACAHALPSLPLGLALSLPHFLLRSPLTLFLPFPSSFACPAANQATHLNLRGKGGRDPTPLLPGGLLW